MTEEMKELGRRAAACNGWRWMEGMVAAWPNWPNYGWRLCWVDGETPTGKWEAGGCNTVNGKVWGIANDGGEPMCLEGYVPDLTDPATLGCLLALVREVAQEPGLHVRCMLPYAPDMSGKTPPPWVLCSGRGARWGDRYETEAAALVAALEAAP